MGRNSAPNLFRRNRGERKLPVFVAGKNFSTRRKQRTQRTHTYLVLPYPEDGVALQEIAGRAVAMAMARVIDGHATLAIAALCRIMQRNLPEVMRELERAD